MNRFFSRKSHKLKSTGPSISSIQIEVLPFQIENENGILSLERHVELVQDLRRTISSQLELLQAVLETTSIVLLWETAQKEQLQPYAWSNCQAIKDDPVNAAEGILGALKDRNEVSLSVYSQNSPTIPYSSKNGQVGSFYATTLFVEDLRVGILCFERTEPGEWSVNDRNLISQSTVLINAHVTQMKNYLYGDFERNALQQVFNGLRSLNSTLGLDSVYQAAVTAIDCVVNADLVAVSTIKQNHHQFDFVSVAAEAQLFLQRFKLEDSIVGQVVKYGRSLPELTTATRMAPVVNRPSLFDNYQSLLVVPLRQEDGPVSAVLIVCAKKADQFPRSCRERIEMISAQVAIKIDLARAHEQINEMTLTDPLSGIANRRAFERALDSMHERAVRNNSCFSLILCDIDFFKKINDNYGHPFGDHVIQQIASQLSAIVRTGDIAARIGGEEFAILVEGSSGSATMAIAERVRNNVETIKFFSQDQTVNVTISIGIASFPHNTKDKETIISYADQALYCAKNEGRNRVVRWNS